MNETNAPRRTYLKTMTAISVAGPSLSTSRPLIAQTDSQQQSTASLGTWPTFGRDVQNTSAVPDGRGITGDIEQKWSYSTAKDTATMPVVDDDVVYVGAGIDRRQATEGKLLALSRTDGAVQWHSTFERSIDEVPTVHDGVVYVGTHSFTDEYHSPREGFLYAIDATTGEQLWRFDPVGGVSTPPTVVDEIVYFGTKGNDTGILQGTAYAVDATTGDQRWETELGWGTFSPPAVDEDNVYIESRAEEDPFYALDRTDGSVVWEYPMPDFKGNGTISNGIAYVTGFRNDARVAAIDADSGNEQWVIETETEVKTSPAVTAERCYFATQSGTIRSADAETGDPIWSETVDDTIVRSPTLVGDIVYFGGQSGRVYAFDTQSGDKRWELSISENPLTEPITVDGELFISDQSGAIYAYSGSATDSESISRQQDEDLSPELKKTNDNKDEIPVLNRFGESGTSLGIGVLGLLGGAGGYAGYRKLRGDDSTDQQSDEQYD